MQQIVIQGREGPVARTTSRRLGMALFAQGRQVPCVASDGGARVDEGRARRLARAPACPGARPFEDVR